jgi:YVTN family beta-propeller protein
MMTKSRSLSHRISLFAALAVFALGLLASPALAARYAYTGNYKNDTVSVIDTATNQIVGDPIPSGEGPYSMAITPNGKSLLVVNESSEDMSVIDIPSKRNVATIPLGIETATVAVTPDGTTAWVTDQRADQAIAIDLRTNTASTPFPVGGEPWGVAFTPDGKTAYVTNDNADTVSVLDVASRQVVGTIPVGEDPINVVFAPDGKTAFVNNYDSDSVSVIDTATRQVVGGPIPTGEEPWGLAMAPNGSRLYVSNEGDDTVTAIDTAARSVIGAPIPTGDEPFELAVTPDGKTVYVANYEGESEGKGVTAINTQTNQTTDVNVTGGPWQIAIEPDQSPVAAFTAKASKKNPLLVSFDSAGSSDPDGAIARFDWNFGDGVTALNGSLTPKHKYAKAGKYTVGLTTTDNEGCSANMVFTGRTASCSGGPSAAAQLITVKAPNNFKFGKLIRNTKKGTAKLKVKVPYAGRLTLFGTKLTRTKRRAKKAGTVVLNIKPKATTKKALETNGTVKVRVKVTFKPTGGKGKTRGRTVKLIQR